MIYYMIKLFHVQQNTVGWVMAKSVTSLPHKHEDLNLDPQNTHKKPGVVVCDCNPCQPWG